MRFNVRIWALVLALLTVVSGFGACGTETSVTDIPESDVPSTSVPDTETPKTSEKFLMFSLYYDKIFTF